MIVVVRSSCVAMLLVMLGTAAACSSFREDSGTRSQDAGARPGDAAADTRVDDAGRNAGAEFCDGFDVGELGARWGSKQGHVKRVTDAFVSPGHALGIDLGAALGAPLEKAYLAKAAPFAPQLTVRAQLRAETSGKDAEIDLIAVDVKNPTGVGRWFLALVRHAGLFTLQEDVELPPGVGTDPRSDVHTALGVDFTDFRALELRIDFAGGKVDVVVGGSVVKSKAIVPVVAADAVEVRIGAAYVAGAIESARIRFDDVCIAPVP